MEKVADNVEKHFKDSLIRRFDQIQELKQKIAAQQIKNAKKRRVKDALVEKHEQTKQGNKLVQNFKRCVDQIV